MAHALGSTDLAPGGTFTATAGLECINCHHQHGSAGTGRTDVNGQPVTSSYRNLRHYTAGTARKNVTYSIGDPKDLTKDVWEKFGAGSTLADHYSQGNIGLLEPVQTASGVAA